MQYVCIEPDMHEGIHVYLYVAMSTHMHESVCMYGSLIISTSICYKLTFGCSGGWRVYTFSVSM